MSKRIKMTGEEWEEKGKQLFGADKMEWKFICPGCGYVASVREWKEAGAESGEIAFSCIGRRLEKKRDFLGGTGSGPCNYAGGGLFAINPVEVEGSRIFAFAE
jgi:hypothetical protein